MKILTVIGARPQFIKASPVSRALQAANYNEVILHTGQHYDINMSDIFFKELNIPTPKINLGIGSGMHGEQTGQMLIEIEKAIVKQNPDLLLVYGDTNSTLAGTLAAVKLNVPVAHVEAGLRSFNRTMPEEHNRVLTDHSSTLLFCPTDTAKSHLRTEGIVEGVHVVGDTMVDAVLQNSATAEQNSLILDKLKIESKKYLLATIHRPYNTDDPHNLRNILTALGEIDKPIVFPIHPRTRGKITEFGLMDLTQSFQKLTLVEPVGYLDMLVLEKNAEIILTDSGGIQKEAYIFSVPCVTMRPETEWVETVDAGWNILAGADGAKIVDAAVVKKWPSGEPSPVFGDGHAAERIVKTLSLLEQE